MINFEDVIGENKTRRNLNYPYTSENSYRILITGGSWSV